MIIFGPERLPQVARQAGQTLRRIRRLAAEATSDLKEGLGPEYADLDLCDLNPRSFVRRHLLEDLDRDDLDGFPPRSPADVGSALRYGERPPYDAEAT